MPSGLHFSQWIDSMSLHQASSEILLASYPPPNMFISISFLWSTADIGPRPTQFLSFVCVCVFACFLLNPYDRISVLSIHLTQNYIIISTVIINNYIYTHIYIYIIYIYITIVLLQHITPFKFEHINFLSFSASSRSSLARMTSKAWKGKSQGGWFTQCSSVTCGIRKRFVTGVLKLQPLFLDGFVWCVD